MKKHIITLLFILVPIYGYTIKGIVKDSTNNSPLIGANVIIDGTSFGAATDSEGNTSDQTHTVTITDVGEKENNSSKFFLFFD